MDGDVIKTIKKRWGELIIGHTLVYFASTFFWTTDDSFKKSVSLFGKAQSVLVKP